MFVLINKRDMVTIPISNGDNKYKQLLCSGFECANYRPMLTSY